MNIIITTHWTDGDIIPFINIGKSLVLRGHKVTLFTHSYYEELAYNASLEFVPWETKEEYLIYINDLNSKILSVNDYASISAFREKYENIDTKISEYEKIVSSLTPKDSIILAKNRSSLSAFLAAEKFNIPLVCVFMNPFEIHSMLAFDHLFGTGLKQESNELRKTLGLPPIKSWIEWQSSADLHIALWPEWFSPVDNIWPKPIKAVGFPLPKFTKTNEDEFEYLNNNGEKPVLITGGTGKMLKPEFYPFSVEACKLSGKNAVLLTRYEEMVPNNLPQSIKWIKYIPDLSNKLGSVSAIIHHGGIGTLSGAALAGIPQLILGDYVDRPFNGAKAKQLKIAEYLPPALWNPKTISELLNNITSDSFRENCINFAKNIENNVNAIENMGTLLENLCRSWEFE
ncbi:MAG: glycosyltransferase [Lachnospiraceae bacterium]|nr:glycosyltransferase [Lachnospiraceae bacterium]